MDDRGDEKSLLRVAQAISDGRKVDWEAEESAHKGLTGRLRRLRILEAVASAHETGPEDSTLTLADPGAIAGSDARSDAPDLRTWGPLSIRERLGQGGFASVYRAFDPSLQREVALKILRTDAGRRHPSTALFLDEARRLARVRHPNVLVVHGADEHDGRPGMWTDLVRGKTLEQALSEQGPLGAQEACLIGIDLCKALAAVHAAGLVHRDVKTSNVMREHGGRIILMDFGSVSEQVRANGSVLPETISGTPLFMAPEQLAGEPVTPASDIYALGVLLYRLVSGRFPVEARSLSELREKHRTGERAPLRDHRPDLPAAFVQVVERALASDPEKRYASAGLMESGLTGALGVVVSERVDRAPQRDLIRPSRAVSIALAAAAALVIGAFALYSFLRPGPLKVEATLVRVANGTEERLKPESLVHTGDHLLLEISAAERFYVYVLGEDEHGEVFVMFPARLDLKNPLTPGVPHRLPGSQAGEQMTWEVTSAGGTEKLLAIASRARPKVLEDQLAGLPTVMEGYTPLSQRTLATLRGIGGLADSGVPSDTARGDVLADIARNLASRASDRDGFWIWQIRLQNPGQ